MQLAYRTVCQWVIVVFTTKSAKANFFHSILNSPRVTPKKQLFYEEAQQNHLNLCLFFAGFFFEILAHEFATSNVDCFPSLFEIVSQFRLGIDVCLQGQETVRWSLPPAKENLVVKFVALTFSGKIMSSLPFCKSSTRGSPAVSRQVKGGNVISFSPGYCSRGKMSQVNTIHLTIKPTQTILTMEIQPMSAPI